MPGTEADAVAGPGGTANAVHGNAMNRDLRKQIRIYLATLACGALLLVTMAFVVVDWVGRRTGSTLLPAELSARVAANGRSIVYRDRIPSWGAIKLARIEQLQPEVIFIGSSRGNSFREQMFAPYRFYNASLTAWTIDQTRVMLEKIMQVASPRVVIFALDYWMFGDQWATAMEALRSMDFDGWLPYKYRVDRGFLETLGRHPSLLRTRVLPSLLGIRQETRDQLDFVGIDAMLHEVGFRADGSFLQPAGYRATTDGDKQYMDSVLRAFPGGRRYDQRQADALERLAALAQSRGIKLIALQLPLARSAIDFLDTDKSYHRLAGLWRESRTEERHDMLQQIGIPYYDLSDQLADNTDFLDAAHLTEKGILEVVLKLSEMPEFRSALPRLDLKKLNTDLAGVTDPGAPAVYPTP